MPALPRIDLRAAESAIAPRRDFLNVERADLVAEYPDGSVSEPFPYDAVVRAGMDAVVLVAYQREAGVRRVFMRTALRPTLALRFGPREAGLWELPAGIVDPGESPREAAARELEEELGFKVDPAQFVELGPWSYPAPGLIAEKHFFFAIDLTGAIANAPTEDGSPLERGALIADVAIDALVDACRRGMFRDAKTELGLRRFAEAP